jgi:antitoxin CcdA
MRMINTQKRATNVSLPSDMVAEAKELGVNLSQACEKGLVAEIATKRREKWIAENMHALESSNVWVEKNGLPFAKYRMF